MDDGMPLAEGEVQQVDKPDEEEALGPFQKSDDLLIQDLQTWFKESADSKSELSGKRKKEWDFLANDQWEKADVLAAKSAKRPALTLNMLQTIISAVEGEERTNRQEMKLYGEGKEDDGAAYGLNRLLKWVMDQCGGEFALSQQFRSEVAVGEGWVVPDVDFFEDPEGKINLVFVDDDEMFDDPQSVDPVGRDSRRLSRVRTYSEDELEARWPGAKEKLRTRCAASGIGPESDGNGSRDIYLKSASSQGTSKQKMYDAKSKLWTVVETWWHQIEPGFVVVNEQSGLLEEKTPDEFEVLKANRAEEQKNFINQTIMGTLQPLAPPQVDPMTGAIIPAVMPQMPPQLQSKPRQIRRYYQAFWAHEVLLDKMASPLRELKRFPYVPARGLFHKSKGEWYGLLRLLIDVQTQHNVEQSVIVQLMQLMPKGAWMAPKGAYHNKNEWQQKISQPGAMLEYNSARGKPEPVEQPALPRHLVELSATRPQSMREICGVNVELMGVRQGSDPGVVMEQRQKAAKSVLAPLFDNFRQSKKELGKVILSFIQTYVSKGRKIRVLGEDGPGYVEMTEQMGLGRYDITVEETNSTVNDRIATLNLLQTTLPQMIKAGVPFPPEIVDLMPMAPHIRDAMKRMVAWQLTIEGMLPPPNWQPGMPAPPPAPPPGTAAPAGAPAPAQPQPATQE